MKKTITNLYLSIFDKVSENHRLQVIKLQKYKFFGDQRYNIKKLSKFGKKKNNYIP